MVQEKITQEMEEIVVATITIKDKYSLKMGGGMISRYSELQFPTYDETGDHWGG